MATTAHHGPDASSQPTNVVDGLPVGWPEAQEIHRVSLVTDEPNDRSDRQAEAGSEAPMRAHGTCDRCGFDFYSTHTGCQAPCPNCGHRASCED